MDLPPTCLKMHCCRVWAGGVAPEITHQRGQKSKRKRGHLFIRKTPTLKIVSNLSLGLPEHGMANASNFKWGLPPSETPKG